MSRINALEEFDRFCRFIDGFHDGGYEGKWTQRQFIAALNKMKNHKVLDYPRYEITEAKPKRRGK